MQLHASCLGPFARFPVPCPSCLTPSQLPALCPFDAHHKCSFSHRPFPASWLLHMYPCRAACHYGDTEAELSSSLSITSGAVFNRVLLFMLKEADGIFRRMLGLPQDTSSAAAGEDKAGVLLAEQVTKAQRWKKVR